MVLDFTRKLSVNLCRYCPLSSILPLWPLLHSLIIATQNNLYQIILRVLIEYKTQTNSSVSMFHLGHSKYLVKSVYSRRVTWLLFSWIKRERFVQIYHIFGFINYLHISFISINQSDLVTKNNTKNKHLNMNIYKHPHLE